jgi:PAS domain S-box-containing protein
MISSILWSLPSLTTLLIALGISIWLGASRRSEQNSLLRMMAGCIALWSCAHFLRTLLPAGDARLWAHAALLPSAMLIASCYLMFALVHGHYTKNTFRHWSWLPIAVALVIFILILREDTRELIYSTLVLSSAASSDVRLELAPLGRAAYSLSFMLVVAGIVTFGVDAFRGGFQSSIYMTVGALGLLVHHFVRNLWLEGVLPVNLAPVAVSAVMLLVVILAWDYEARFRHLSDTSILNELPDAMLFVSREGVVADMNPQAQELFGVERGSIVGAHMEDLMGRNLRNVSMAGVSQRRWEDIALESSSGKYRIDVTVTRIDRSNGAPLMYACLLENRTFYRDNIDRLRDLSDDLLVKVHELGEVNSTKRRFLTQFSSTIRLPLEKIVADARVLDSSLNREEGRAIEFLHEIDRNASHLKSVVHHIDAFQQSIGHINLVRVDVDVVSVLDSVLSSFQAQISDKQISAVVDCSEADLIFRLDISAFRQMLMHLVGNAIRFTSVGGNVTVEAQGQNNVLRVAVVDSGIGIDPSDQVRIFRPFEQVDASFSRLESGTGLGLALVRRLAAAHGGSIGVVSVLGKGSRFFLEIPA